MSKVNFEKFFGREWSQILQPFLQSSQYRTIGDTLVKLLDTDIEVAPELPNIYRAFLECPFPLFHTLIIGMDPYNHKTYSGEIVADGIAFSSMNSSRTPKSLEIIYDAIDKTVYDGQNTSITDTNDLTKWANQGVLLLNCALTAVVNHSGWHIPMWRPFIQFVIKAICENKDNIGVILIGTHARYLKNLFTNSTYRILECEHPSAASRANRRWDHNNVFVDLAEFHEKNNNIKINW